ncbi:hypothetical protein HDZ31DRAFT_33863 [Schizophyllum fasciatum]
MSASRASSVRRVRSENDVASADASPLTFLPTATAPAPHVAPAPPPSPLRTSTDALSTLSAPPPALTRSERYAQSAPPAPPPAVAQASEGPPTARPPRPSIAPFRHDRSLFTRARIFFGYGRDGSRERRALVGLYWRMSWGLVQIAAIIILLAIAGHTESPNPYRDGNEWAACDRPLGEWSIVWAVRVVLSCAMHYWGWTRDRVPQSRTDAESRPGVSLTNLQPPLAHEPGSASAQTHAASTSSQPSTSPETPALPHTKLYARLNTLVSLLTLTWFLTAHILEYTSVNTCRHDAPHLWWLIFGILCIMYLMVLEVLALGMVVFIIAPVLFLAWNVFLICLGRHPLQAGAPIRPAIGKLPKDAVDCIPLVMYIPPPPEDEAKQEGNGKGGQLDGDEQGGHASGDAPGNSEQADDDKDAACTPEASYEYPPKAKEPRQPRRHKWFKFLRRRRGKEDADREADEKRDGEGDGEKKGAGGSGNGGQPARWEDHWDLEGFPSVVLEGNRAACAICLMDFEEPRRVGSTVQGQSVPSSGPTSAPGAEGPAETSTQGGAPDGATSQEALDRLRLEDAGEGAQPLRLLACGHVFHQTCLDPWLIDVSGRCPVCQRPVEIPEPPAKERRRGRR